MSRAIIVTGATGKQGGALIEALLAEGTDFRILALTRDATSPSAQKLAAKSKNISVIQGDLNDPDSIFSQARKLEHSIWGVFSVQTIAFSKNGPAIEEKQGKDLVDASLKNAVEHFVYCSVDRGGERSSDNVTNVPHFASKHRIEKHLISASQGSNMSWTILRPVTFMDNFDGGFMGKVVATSWRLVVKSRPLQLIATEDIGVFGAKAFISPQEFSRKAITLAGDELTYPQLEKTFLESTGAPVPTTWGIVARLLLWKSEELGTMFGFFEREGFGADINELRKVHPEIKDLTTWLGEQQRR